ncbi:MAG TPA: peptide chain release factor N(5)-glutamine methyltransferase [Opitutaceae bacterium]|jgi:release factor glutamine methyltransferase|nr:peptide chain release factor N(5)-glutamine methyltransferase [Opitutaceae bacterium]
MLTVLEVIKKTTGFFTDKGIENPRLNAELLVGHALGLKRMQLYLKFEQLLTEAELEKIRPLVRRRGVREPVQYIVGETEFFGLKFKTDRRALIPRPETERLLEIMATRLAGSPPAQVLDLGTGSGALALGLATAFPAAMVTAVDSSESALALARENAAALGLAERVKILQSDWFSALPAGGLFELIVANPPYLSVEETAQAAPEVRDFEPVAALTAGGQGIDELKKILVAAPRFLAPGGLLALETGIAQHAELIRLAAEAGFSPTESLQDLAGRDRYVLAWR